MRTSNNMQRGFTQASKLTTQEAVHVETMVNRMRTIGSRHRTGSDSEVSVKPEKGMLAKEQGSSRFIPANGQLGSADGKKSPNNSDTTPCANTKRQNAAPSSAIRRETVPRVNAAPRQTGANTRPPVTRLSSSEISLTRTPSWLGLRRSPSKLSQKKSTSKSINSKSTTKVSPPAPPPPSQPSQPVTMKRAPSRIMQRQQQYYGSKRTSRSQGSVGSMKSFKKSLGFRPKCIPRKITPRISDDWSFFTFNTVSENRANLVHFKVIELNSQHSYGYLSW